ncbi:hypothetical protein CVU76_02505 [Candidatus Dojkabacteria bacterium HGW-Dojkabacteria-1]|uniref:Uncharacterized protein n=1 Tax=Candidatus Dojkabacteria bacterium HGW-Dojkabacteria-1 TaxID=2013761 RepID=A0A2N2F3Z4_9BACT|nr:MAG: hypothetical protein CVU76_02505 [Candidatus Dojkabacteria bacterium HGW-Dojkabacteria-1]
MANELEKYNENILHEYSDAIYIDPRTELPEGFPDISEHLKHLGDEPLDVFTALEYMRVAFPGGEIEYFENNQEGYPKGLPLINRIVIYGITSEPGVRARNTKGFDTHILFDLIQGDEVSNLSDDDWKNYYRLESGALIKVTVMEPEQKNVKSWWNSGNI